MYKDTQKELKRLEEELLAEETAETPKPGLEETMLFHSNSGEFLPQTQTDTNAPPHLSDDDLKALLEEAFAETPPVRASKPGKYIRQEEGSLAGLTVLAIVLTLGIVAVAGWWIVRLSGL